MQTTKKTCFKCLCNLPVEAFYKHSRMSDGYLGKCKECTKKDVRQHRSINLDYIRQYDRERASKPHRIDLRASVVAKYAVDFPSRKKANTAVNNAIRNGSLVRLPCQVCGDERSVGHHSDYDRPLDVVWLCQSHHKQLHAEHRKRNNQ